MPILNLSCKNSYKSYTFVSPATKAAGNNAADDVIFSKIDGYFDEMVFLVFIFSS